VAVVAAREFRTPLEPWIERRLQQGFRVVWIDPVAVLGTHEAEEAAERLRAEIARQFATLAPPPAEQDHATPPEHPSPVLGFVLLVGDAPAPRHTRDPASLIPGGIRREKARPTLDRQFVSDNSYGLPDPAGISRLAVGRWPVRTPEEVATQVRKALRFELEQRPRLQRGCVTFLATTPNYDPLVDPVLERTALLMIGTQLHARWDVRALYSSPRSQFFPGPNETARQVVRWFEDATPITLFAGHGYESGVDSLRYDGKQHRVLDTELAETVRGGAPGTILWLSACSCGDFDLADGRGLAESLMMNPLGPTAVVAGSDVTSAYANTLHCLGLARDVLEQSPETLGEAFLRWKQAAYRPAPGWLKRLLLSLEPAERPEFLAEDHQFLYNLLGDPTLPLLLPRRVEFQASITEEAAELPDHRRFRISGELPGWDSGSAMVMLLLDRLAQKDPLPDPAAIDDTSARATAYGERFAKANDKMVAQGEAAVVSGRFELSLSVPHSLAPRVRWLRLYVHSKPEESGGWFDGTGAQAVRLVAESQAEERPPR
jgi:hypothetical protein